MFFHEFNVLKPRVVQIVAYRSQQKVNLTCFILVQVRLGGFTPLILFGTAESRNMTFWMGAEVRKLYRKTKTILVLAVSWISIFVGFCPPYF